MIKHTLANACNIAGADVFESLLNLRRHSLHGSSSMWFFARKIWFSMPYRLAKIGLYVPLVANHKYYW